jgi:hypothetical protein
MKWVIYLLIAVLSIISCDKMDKRLKIINKTKRTGFCDYNIGEKNRIRFPTCIDLDEYKKSNWFIENSDSTWMGTLGNWDNLLEKDQLVIYFYDSAKFERYCKGQIPIDSTYMKYYCT